MVLAGSGVSAALVRRPLSRYGRLGARADVRSVRPASAGAVADPDDHQSAQARATRRTFVLVPRCAAAKSDGGVAGQALAARAILGAALHDRMADAHLLREGRPAWPPFAKSHRHSARARLQWTLSRGWI